MWENIHLETNDTQYRLFSALFPAFGTVLDNSKHSINICWVNEKLVSELKQWNKYLAYREIMKIAGTAQKF